MPSDDEGGGAAAAPAHERKVGLMGMIVMGFFWVCGGMYGNEELLGTAPPALVLLALIVVPCCHSLPVSMMIAECGTAWPADGGASADGDAVERQPDSDDDEWM